MNQVFFRLRLIFRQEQKGDPHGNVGGNQTAAPARLDVATCHRQAVRFDAQHRPHQSIAGTGKLSAFQVTPEYIVKNLLVKIGNCVRRNLFTFGLLTCH